MGFFWKCPKCKSTNLRPSRLTKDHHRCRECNTIVKAELWFRNKDGECSKSKNDKRSTSLLNLRRKTASESLYRIDAFIEV